jgi:hypothetical protein
MLAQRVIRGLRQSFYPVQFAGQSFVPALRG